MSQPQHRLDVLARDRHQERVEPLAAPGHHIVLLEQLAQNDVAHREARGGEVHAPQGLQQPVVASAAADGAQRAPHVKQLEHDAGVVVEPPHYGEVHVDEVTEPHRVQHRDALGERRARLLAPGSCQSFAHRLERPDLADIERAPSRFL